MVSKYNLLTVSEKKITNFRIFMISLEGTDQKLSENMKKYFWIIILCYILVVYLINTIFIISQHHFLFTKMSVEPKINYRFWK